MTGRYEISVSFDGYYTFALFVGSGSPLLEGQEHSTLPLCRKGIASVRLNCDAPLEDMCADETAPPDTPFVQSFTPGGDERSTVTQEGVRKAMKCPKFVLDRNSGMYRITLYAKNGKPVQRTPPNRRISRKGSAEANNYFSLTAFFHFSSCKSFRNVVYYKMYNFAKGRLI